MRESFQQGEIQILTKETQAQQKQVSSVNERTLGCFTVDRLLNSFNAQVEGSHVFNLCAVENDIFLNSFHHCQTSHYKLAN